MVAEMFMGSPITIAVENLTIGQRIYPSTTSQTANGGPGTVTRIDDVGDGHWMIWLDNRETGFLFPETARVWTA